MISLRIAFLTPEYPLEYTKGSGLGSYVQRMARALSSMGHELVVVTLGRENEEYIEDGEVIVYRVTPEWPWWLCFLQYISRRAGRYQIGNLLANISWALAFSRRLKKLEQDKPFQVVQSTNYGLVGLFVRTQDDCCHMLRMSSDQRLWRMTDGDSLNLDLRCRSRLELHSIRQADIAYAPSQWLARHFENTYGLHVRVLRPPLVPREKVNHIDLTSFNLPVRYLVHFGKIGPRKGSDFIAQALQLVWESEPDFTMVWVGRESRPGDLQRCYQLFGVGSDNILYLGQVKNLELLSIVQAAEASVLPSRVDNLPNTALESLAMGTPVIGVNGASLDEIIEPGFNGDLVEFGATEQLAEAMLNVWQRKSSWQPGNIRLPDVFTDMQPEAAAQNFLHLAGFPNNDVR